jgi:hypothetical protein
LSWATEGQIRESRSWLRIVASLVGLLLWANLSGTALDTPGVSDTHALIAAGLGVAVFAGSFLLKKRLLGKNQQA